MVRHAETAANISSIKDYHKVRYRSTMHQQPYSQAFLSVAAYRGKQRNASIISGEEVYSPVPNPPFVRRSSSDAPSSVALASVP